jgi:hypothetical protein
MKKLTITIAGMRHHMTPSTLKEVAGECPLKVELRREPENHHDENAIAVYCMEKPWKHMKFGYVARQTAGELSPRIDKGRMNFDECWLTEVDESGFGEMLVKAEILKAKQKSKS